MNLIVRRVNAVVSLIKWVRERRRDSTRFIDLFERDMEEIRETVGPLTGKRVLDIGCGMNYPHVVIFGELGCDVTGIDLEVVPPGEGLRGYLQFARKKGRKAGLKALLYHYVIDRKIHGGIQRKLGDGKRRGPADVRVMDAGRTVFDDNTFDLIYSCATLEHVDALPEVLAETKRIMKPGAIATFGIHLYASRSGGHNLELRDPATGKIAVPPPWDHLRENVYPSKLYLNKLRETEFRSAFEEQGFEIIGWRRVEAPRETEDKLTPELETELAEKGYTRDELLTEAVAACVRKPRTG